MKHIIPSSLLLLVVALASSVKMSASSYQVIIGAFKTYPLAWHFQASTVGAAFPTPADADRVHIWDAGNQQFLSTTADGGWDTPSLPLNPGDGFYYYNSSPNALTLTVSGTDNTTPLTNTFLANNFYFLCTGFPMAYATFPECQLDHLSQYRGPANAFNWPLNMNDIFHTWSVQLTNLIGSIRKPMSVATACNDVEGQPYWPEQVAGCNWANGTLTPPPLSMNYGFFYRPSTNVTWIRTGITQNCGP